MMDGLSAIYRTIVIKVPSITSRSDDVLVKFTINGAVPVVGVPVN
jgi:hypothetical protein